MELPTLKIVLFLLLFLPTMISGKVYKRCKLARELKNKYKVPSSKLATWVCIASYESHYNTKAIGGPNKNGSKDFGIFQINNWYWCSPPGRGCKVPCSKLIDNDISDDYACAKKIQKIQGFAAWTVYKRHCQGSKAKRFIKGCF